MRKLCLSVCAGALLVGSVSAQTAIKEILYYKFLKGTGTSVINFANASMPGKIMGNEAKPWTTGHTNNALRGTMNTSSSNVNYVDSGFKGPLKGDMTVAWWQKQEHAPGTSLSYIFSGMNSFRCFTNGVAGRGLWMRAWGGPDIKLGTNVQTISNGKWAHIALVMDFSGTKTATWYVNGVAQTPIPITTGLNVPVTTNAFRVGKHTSDTFSYAYNIDEFRLMNRAADAAEVAAWAGVAGDGAFNTPNCGAKLSANNGPPAIPNAKYALALQGTASRPYVTAIGFKRGVITVDLGLIWAVMKGCVFDNDFTIVTGGATNGSGSATMPFPIPNAAALKGLHIYAQSIVIATQGSNGWHMFLQ